MAEPYRIPNHPSFQNLTGKSFGELIVVAYAGASGNGAQWVCQCSQGHEQVAVGSALTRGRITHCKTCLSIRPDTKTCRKCKQSFPFDAEHFPENCQHPFGLRAICRACRNEIMRPDSRKRTQTIRLEVLTHYSGGTPKCACCAETVLQFLALDHLEGSSQADYRQFGNSCNYFSHLRKSGFPKGFQVLCHNCNESKAHYGYCVHRPEDRIANYRCQNANTLPPFTSVTADLFTKYCRVCGRAFPFDINHFPKHKQMAAGLLNMCKECDREVHNEQLRSRKRRQKEQVFRHYCQGEPHCLCCKETIFEFLTIDHIECGGSKHRKADKIGNMYSWLIKNGMPTGYAPLCFNCNMAKGFYGSCPHNR